MSGKIIDGSASYSTSGNYPISAKDSRDKTAVFDYNEQNGNLNSVTVQKNQTTNITTNYTYDEAGRLKTTGCS